MSNKGFGRGKHLQWLRKATQLSVLFFIVYGAVSIHWRNLKIAHNNARLVGLLHNDTAEAFYRFNHRIVELFGDPLAVSESVLGAPWHMEIAGIAFTDPWATAALLAGGTLPPLALFLSALLPLGIALVLGKVFCSFICPARLMFEIGSGVRRGLMRLGLPLPALSIPRLGLWVGLSALIFAALSSTAVFHYVLPYATLSSSVFSLVMTGAVTSSLLWLGAIFTMDVLIAPGQFCRSICPTGALLENVGRKRLVVLDKVKDSACPSSCDLCQRACPYGLFPGKKAHLPACDSCGRCTPVCPDGKLAHALNLPGSQRP